MIALAVLGAFVAGLAFGAAGSRWLMWDGFKLAATYQRTGKATASAPVEIEDGGTRTMPSPEASALRQITEDAVMRGAEQLMDAAKAQGIPMSRREAEEQAREMLKTIQPLGGVM